MNNPAISSLKCLFLPLLIFFFLEISLPKATARSQDPFSNIFLNSEFYNEDESLDVTLRTCTPINPALNYRPVIGILSNPGDCASYSTEVSCIAASYVKFVECAGARVIPLIYDEPAEVLEEKLSLVNGVLITGEWFRPESHNSAALSIFMNVLKRNHDGDHVPLYGLDSLTVISFVVSQDGQTLEEFNAENMASTLQFNRNANIQGTLIQGIPLYLRNKAATDCIAWHNHNVGISREKFEQNERLSQIFQILTTSNDRDGKVFVSTVNAKNYPITLLQWGPQKNAFEWGIPTIPHTSYAVELTQKVANYLVSEARKSTNSPSPQKILDNLIYNYMPTYSGKDGKGHDQVYLFEKKTAVDHFII